jgi:hypothetical protein
MTIFTPRVLKWLQENMSCRRFARHVAKGEEPSGGPYPRFHFYLHWAVCPFCRRYWREIKQIGAAQRVLSQLSSHPAVKLLLVKQRLSDKLKRKYA